jgi:hypothetical protein
MTGTEHTHPRKQRWTDTPWVVIGKGLKNLGSLCLAVIAIVAVSGYITKGKNYLLDPHTVALAACLDSANNCKINRRFDSNECRISRVERNYDSVSLWMIETRCYQKRAMTFDQQIQAENDFNEMKKAWEKGHR